MQFHLNGFQPGDPNTAPTAEPQPRDHPSLRLPRQVDVLIVGCGPAGLTLAAQLAAFPDITTCIVEQKHGPLQLGQADGIACRTMEMFEAFGFAERVAKEACWINEVTFWKPDTVHPEHIVRHSRVQDTEDGLSEFPHVVLNQARVHDFYLDVMRNSAARLVPYYSRTLVNLTKDISGASGYPVSLEFETPDPEREVTHETVDARYVVGCDGARSVVRELIGRRLVGDSANQAWGVMDVLAVTDFPDIRLKTAVQSSQAGNLLVIPREGGYLVRLYVEMDKLGEGERINNRAITVDSLITAAGRILHPYTLDVKEVAWWSVYEIGQRLCDRFDDSNGANTEPRVFIAGDACHTHSPKAGQGMNVSMQDTFNLGWKLAAVLRGQARPELLHTYSNERHAIAVELIDFDREWAAMFSDRPVEGAASAEDGIDPQAFQAYFVQHARYTAGVGTHYRPSMITGDSTHQHLARGFTIGERFHSAPVIRLADAKPLHLGHSGKADGRWRLYLFGDRAAPDAADSEVSRLCQYLMDSPKSPVSRFTPPAQDVDAVFDVRAVLQQNHDEVGFETLPALLRPRKGRYELTDYEKVFCADPKTATDIFDLRAIDRDQGLRRCRST